MPTDPTWLSPDRPLEDPSTDRLGYASFAKALAEAIAAMEAPDGIVVALYGAWGLGKTTALNFIEHYLSHPDNEQAAETIILRFNPWLFTGRLDLAIAYLSELQKTFRRSKMLTREARKSLSKLAKIVGGVPVPGAEVVKGVGEALDPGSPDVHQLKSDIAKALANEDKRLVVVIDDIDRLTPTEIRELFSVIKSVADFPNTVYVLAFAKEIVAAALSEGDAIDGMDYIEKIIQVPFELPLPEDAALRALLLERLEAIIGEVDDDLFDSEDFGTILQFGLMPLLSTPRDVIRLTNSLRVTYAAVRGQVNVVDFIGLEALRIFLPLAYESIRGNPEMYGIARDFQAAFRATQQTELAVFHEKWVQAMDDREGTPAKELVSWLFPSTAQPLGTHLRRSRNALEIRRGRHVMSPDFYALYFRLTLGDTIISRELVAAMVERAEDPDAFCATLLDLAAEKTSSGRTRASVMLDELVGQTEKFDLAAIPGLIKAFLNVGDELWIDDDEEFLAPGNELRIWFIVEGLLERVERGERVSLIERAIEDAASVATPARIVSALGQKLGAERNSIKDVQVHPALEETAPVNSDGVRRLEEVAVRRITKAANESNLLDAPGPGWLMAKWAVWGSPADVSAWLNAIRANDERLGRFLIAALETGQTRAGETRYRLNPQWFADYVDRDALAADVRRLEASATGEVATAVRQFLVEYEMLEAGKDPDYPMR